MKPEDFIGKEVYYEEAGQMIFGIDEQEGMQLLLEISVRGWGAIQHLFDDEDDAAKFQDQVGQFIADAINEKLSKSK